MIPVNCNDGNLPVFNRNTFPGPRWVLGKIFFGWGGSKEGIFMLKEISHNKDQQLEHQRVFKINIVFTRTQARAVLN